MALAVEGLLLWAWEGWQRGWRRPRPSVWLELESDGAPLGRVVLELYTHAAPILCENFRRLVTGEVVDGFKRRLHYKGSRLHAVYPGTLVAGGDVVSGNGTGGVSAVDEAGGREHKPDPRRLNFDEEGTVAAAGMWDGDARAKANSQFFVCLEAVGGGLGAYPDSVPFARVVHGLPLLRRLQGHPVSGQPLSVIRIKDCGLV